jgi:lipopolysaccharide transport system ATP-binding protein
MSDIALQVENLSKKYTIGRKPGRSAGYATLRDEIANGVRSLLTRRGRREEPSTFWALSDVSFDVKHGEVIGIIGRNGAGKSTLLKILSRITVPTRGRARIYGRVGSLLEVGTGFHQELTGRENIFLNGAILGMTRAEINRKFDEIVAFSEIEDFLDTPVKRYSSGMYVRLAFAVAAHLEPEVLIVDEVLAVGDTGFQTKCLGKMSDVAGHGRTVLFVSHNMAAVQHLCSKALVLANGRVKFAGNTNEAIDHYTDTFAPQGESDRSHSVDLVDAPGRRPAYKQMLTRLELFTDQGKRVNGLLNMGAPLKLDISFKTAEAVPDIDLSLVFRNHVGQSVLEISSLYQHHRPVVHAAGDHTFTCEIPSLTLVPGDYRVSVYIDIHTVNVDRVEDAVRLTVVEADYYGGGKIPQSGFFVLKNRWRDVSGERTRIAPHAEMAIS